MQIFQGVTKNSNECVIRCIGKIQESPDINGVTFAKSKRQCFCKIKMVNIAVSQDHETCFLSSKSMLVSIKTVLPHKCFHKYLVSVQKFPKKEYFRNYLKNFSMVRSFQIQYFTEHMRVKRLALECRKMLDQNEPLSMFNIKVYINISVYHLYFCCQTCNFLQLNHESHEFKLSHHLFQLGEIKCKINEKIELQVLF